MCTGAEIAAIAGVVGTGYSVYSGERANSQAKAAQQEARNAPRPIPKQEAVNPTRFRNQNMQGELAGIASTLLTGPGGLSPGSTSIGKTLLGS